MKAMVLHKPGPVEDRPLAASEVPGPDCGRDDIVVQVAVCGVCRTDLHVVEGELPPVGRPVIPGHEVVGTVVARGTSATRFNVGERVGAGWMHSTCGRCSFCGQGREQLCEQATFTGYTADGGYAELLRVPEAFAYRMPQSFSDEQAAPLLCAGIIGYRAFRATGVGRGQHLGLYGFGGSAHIVLQLARHLGGEMSVFTRSEANRRLARELGAAWVGESRDPAPRPLDGAIIFAPDGGIVPLALEALARGGTLVLAGIHMSDTPPLAYRTHLYDEKTIRSVANATRDDATELLALAERAGVRTSTTEFPLESANEALVALKTGRITGAAVLRVGPR